jgi:uncharacterized linocin/CFP29 family protein
MNYSKTTSASAVSRSMTNGAMANGSTDMGNREQVTYWLNTDNWNNIDTAIGDEDKLKVAARFLPCYPLPGATSALRGIISSNKSQILSIQQSDTMPLIELMVQFALTVAQVKDEAQWQMGVTLAHRAGALVALAEDLVIFQGDTGLSDPVFKTVLTDGSDAGTGLVFAAPEDQVIKVFPVEEDLDDPSQNRYGENTFGAVAQAFALLQKTHYERIKGLVGEHFYSSSTLPERTGILVAIDGDTMDLVVGQDPFTEFTQVNNSQWIFRLYERIGLRLKDPTAVVRLEFQKEKKYETRGESEESSKVRGKAE